MIPTVESMMFEINKCSNPYYQQGYWDGYEQAKSEMLALLKTMTAFYDSSTATLFDKGEQDWLGPC